MPLFSLIGVAFETVATLLGVAIYTVSYAIFVHASNNDDDNCAGGKKTRDKETVNSNIKKYDLIFTFVGECVQISCIIYKCINYIHDMDNFLYCQGTNG